MEKLFEINNLKCSYDKNYREGISKVVLNINDLVIPKGEKVFIVGESGIGKSTILEVLGLMNNTIVPSADSVFKFYGNDNEEVDLIKMWMRNDDAELSDLRRQHFNFIFQSTNLMKNFTAYENISITRMLQGYTQYSSFKKANKVMEYLGLGHISQDRMTTELSGGQQQRLAFARAIIPDFTVLFGDEPTGNLDGDNAVRAMELLSSKLEELKGSSAVIVSHDMHLAVSFADVIIKITKCVNKCNENDDEETYFGHIDKSCEYRKVDGAWTNGENSYSDDEFEKFLKLN